MKKTSAAKKKKTVGKNKFLEGAYRQMIPATKRPKTGQQVVEEVADNVIGIAEPKDTLLGKVFGNRLEEKVVDAPIRSISPGTLNTFPTHRLELTSDPHLFRVVDRDGDWLYYYHDVFKQYFPAVNHVISMGFPKDPGLIEWIRKTSKEESEKIFKSAGERGSKIHAAIRDLIDGVTVTPETAYENDAGKFEKLSPDEWDYTTSWVEWAKVFRPQVNEHETAVCFVSPTPFAGTKDFDGTITIPAGAKVYVDGSVTTFKEEKTISVILDWKSGAASNSHLLQIAAYWRCTDHQSAYTGIVRIGTAHKNGGWEMKLYSMEQTKKHLKLFWDAYETFQFVTGYTPDFVPEIKQIPSSLTVNVPFIGEKKNQAKAKT
jgi:hypothetical protein